MALRFFHFPLVAVLWILPMVPLPPHHTKTPKLSHLSTPQPRAGKDHAIFFANEIYPNGWDRLKFPKSDVKKIADELRANYGFADPVIYENKSRSEILNILSEWQRRNWQPDEQLLVFFSGHGYYDSFCTGYYVPKDGAANDPGGASYLEWSSIQSRLAGSGCRHILLVADACFAGTADLKKTCPHLFEGDKGPRDPVRPNQTAGRDRLIQQTLRDQARLYFAAAGNTTTNDRSEFTRLFLDALQNDYDREHLLDMGTLRKRLRLAQPTPQFSTFAGNQDNEAFLFVRNTPSTTQPKLPPKPMLEDYDDDGTADAEDKCPYERGPANTKGCPDSDSDGVADKFDECPYEKGPTENNGCPKPTDADNDGIADAEDKCPYERGPANTKGCPDTDSDGVADKFDKCPYEKGPADNDGCPKNDDMVFVKGGTFQMGSNDEESDEKPGHRVTVSDFYIGKYEVTQKLWREVMGSDPPQLYFKGCDDCPVERVSWDDIQEFLKKINAKYPSRNYRLPTEAEWEYAARGGSQSQNFKYSGSNEVDAVSWYNGNSNSKTHPVGSKKANELGIFDMSGNVWEWCSDWYGSDYYKNSPAENPKGPASGSGRVFRGGSWYDYPQLCRVANRFSSSPGFRSYNLGFRLSRTD